MKAIHHRLRSLALLLLLLAAPAWASRWVSVVDGQERAVYLDTAGLTREGAVVRAWMREVHTQEQRSNQVGVLYYSANSLVSYDCQRRTWAPLFRVFYGSDGTEVRRVNLDAAELPALAAPGSLQETLLERACAPEPKPGKAQARAEPKLEAKAEPGADPAKPAQAEGAVQPAAAAANTAAAGENPAAPVTARPAAAAPVKHEAARAPAAPRARARDAVMRTTAYETHRARARRASRPEAAPVQPVPEEVHWSYEGTGGPERWGKLNPEYETCARGQRQSPIDIKGGARLDLQPIAFDYKPSPLRIVDNGHTVQVNYAEGSSITVAGERYELKQFHFHKPAEERIDGRRFDMVAHLVHRSSEGRLAVIAVLFEAREQSNPFLRALWPHLPLEQGRESAPRDVTIDANAMLPEVRTYFTYIGSLTTPPCTEGVLWLVLKTPVEIAPDQVAVFGKLYSMNARPVQPAHGRLIKESM